MKYGYIGVKPSQSSSGNSGVFSIEEQYKLKRNNQWSNKQISTGNDGNYTLTSTATLNTETYLSSSASINATSVSVNSSSGISAGDRILICQQEGTSSNTGNWDYVTISSVSGTTLNLSTPLRVAFTLGTATVVRVPQYDTFNLNSGGVLTCSAYNGTRGGVIAIAANTINLNGGLVDANGKGYRGSYHSDSTSIGTFKNGARGEGYTGSYQVETTSRAGGSGGGGRGGVGGSANGGGAGGAAHRSNAGNGVSSGSNGTGGQGGYAYGTTDLLTRATMGAGGSCGGRHDVSGVLNAGEGGGVVYLFADNFTRSANTNIRAEGTNASRSGNFKGGVSSGAGGSIVIACSSSVTGTATIGIEIDHGVKASGSNNGGAAGDSSQGRFAYYGPSFTFYSTETMDVNTSSFDLSKFKIG